MSDSSARSTQFLRRVARRGGAVAARIGVGQELSHIVRDAHGYWTGEQDGGWLSNSHWLGGLDDDVWLEVGRDHRALFDEFAKALDRRNALGVVAEWGCGGGANAVAFAPDAGRFIAADVSEDSVVECIRQVEAVCDTPTEPVVIDIEHLGRAATGLEGTCDVFLCLYVLDLTAGPAEALRIMKIAEQLLRSGGIAFVQVKYHTAEWRTRGRTRNYRRNLANMTAFGIDESGCTPSNADSRRNSSNSFRGIVWIRGTPTTP